MKSAEKCPLFTVISAAADGDVMAIEKILKHYDAYICKASLRPLYDEYGNIYIGVFIEIEKELQLWYIVNISRWGSLL